MFYLGTAVFAFEGVNMVVPIAESMKRPEKFPLCLTSVLMGVCVVLASIGTSKNCYINSIKISTHIHFNL